MARVRSVLLLLLALGALACDSQETRLAQHREKGDALLAEQKWAEAALEFKNALSVDPNSAEAHYGLALSELPEGDHVYRLTAYDWFGNESDPSEVSPEPFTAGTLSAVSHTATTATLTRPIPRVL